MNGTVRLGGAGAVLGASRPTGGGACTRGRLGAASVGDFTRSHALVSPVRARAGGAGRVGAGRLALGSLTLSAGFVLVEPVSCGSHTNC